MANQSQSPWDEPSDGREDSPTRAARRSSSHRRLWWDSNPITLGIGLFVLVWVRELSEWSPGSIALIGVVGAILWSLPMLGRIIQSLDRRRQRSTELDAFRAQEHDSSSESPVGATGAMESPSMQRQQHFSRLLLLVVVVFLSPSLLALLWRLVMGAFLFWWGLLSGQWPPWYYF